MRPTALEKAAFERDGAVPMKGVVPAAWLAVLADVRRRGYAVRYCGEGCTYFAGPGPNRDLRNPALADGDALDSAQYPVVWP